MATILLPDYLSMTQEQWDEDLKAMAAERDYVLELILKHEKAACDLEDRMIEEYKASSDEMKGLQVEANRIQIIRESLADKLTELELTVKDVQEEIITMKSQCEQIEQEIHSKSETLNNYTHDIETEKTRINGIVEKIKSKYNYNKSTINLFSKLFNCKLNLVDEATQVYGLVLKNESGNNEVTVRFQVDSSFPSSTSFQLLDIKSSPQMEPDFFKNIQDIFHKSQDSQGLLAFLHANYIKPKHVE